MDVLGWGWGDVKMEFLGPDMLVQHLPVTVVGTRAQEAVVVMGGWSTSLG